MGRGAHVHICVGYDDEWLYIQDPGSFQRRHLRLEGFDHVHAHSGYWALAFVPAESASLLDVLPPEEDAAIRRMQACWEHIAEDRLAEARALFAEIEQGDWTVASAFFRLRVWPRLGTREGALEAANWLLAQFPDHRQIRLEVAHHLMRLDQEDRAVALVREHVGRQPSRALIILADAARRASLEEARQLYRKAAIEEPDSALPLARWGEAELQVGNLDRAEALFEAAYEMEPSPGRVAALAHLRFRQGRHAEAVAGFRQALREDRFYPWAWWMRAEAHWALGQHRAAARCLRIAVSLDPDGAHLVDRLADLYSEMGDPARAIALLRGSPLLASSANLQYSLAILLGGEGEWTEALAVAEAAMRQFPDDIRFGPFLAECLRMTGRPAEGRALFAAMAREHPDHAYIQARFGRYLLLEGEIEEGLRRLDRALQLRPGWRDPLDWALAAAEEADRPVPILGYLTEKLLPAGDPVRLASLARLWLPHDTHRARELAMAAWNGSDVPPGVLGDIADVLLSAEDARGALAALRQALHQARFSPWGWWCRARAHWALGQRRAAVRAMRIAIAQDPQASDPVARLAEWYEAVGREDRALALLRESPLTAGSAALQHDLARLLLRLRRYEEALEVAQGALRQFGDAARFGPVAAEALVSLGNRAEALALLTRLSEQAEAAREFGSLRELARAWARCDLSRALRWGKKALELLEDERLRDLSYGLMLAEFGRHDEAEAVLRQVVEHVPDPGAFHALSVIAEEKGDQAAQIAWLRRAVEAAGEPQGRAGHRVNRTPGHPCEDLVQRGVQGLDGTRRRQVARLERRNQPQQGAGRVGGADLNPVPCFANGRIVQDRPADAGGSGERVRVGPRQPDAGCAVARLQLSRRSQCPEPAAVHDRDPVAQHVGLLQVVGGHDHGGALGVQRADQLPQLVPAVHVQPRRRFVQDQQLRPVEGSRSQLQPLLHPAGVVSDQPVGGGH